MTKALPAAIAVTLTLLMPGASPAASPAEIDRLFDARGTPRLLEIMREEGLAQADELRETSFPNNGGGWGNITSRIYDTGRMAEIFRDGFEAELADEDIGALLAFFDGELGREIVELELAGREALLDPDVEAAAVEAYEALGSTAPEFRARIDRFVDGNDLIELNVMGAMNASLAFYNGLADGGALEMSEEQILADVWGQEPGVRADTEEWMRSYLAMAYEPLSGADLDAYIDFTLSPAGRDLNRALFTGFDALFNDISYALGAAAARFMLSEDI